MDYEVRTSERYRRYVSLVMLDLRDQGEKSTVPQWLETMRTETIRSSDHVIPLEHSGVVAILMGETSHEGALRALERLQSRYGEAVAIRASVASYPRDGHTSRDLLSVAQRRLYSAMDSGPGTVVWNEPSAKDVGQS